VHEKGKVRYWLPEKMLRDLQAQEYDLSVAVRSGYDSLLAWISMAVNARQRVGFVGKAHRFDFAYNIPLPAPRGTLHQVEADLELMRDFNLPKRSDDISLELPSTARARARTLMSRWGITDARPFAVFQLSSAKKPASQWPLEHFIALGRRFLGRGIPVYANGLPVDRPSIEKLCAALGPSTRAACIADMGDYLGFLRAARVVVGSDGGGIHLAAAMGTHTAAFYSESSPAKWRPWQGEHLQFEARNGEAKQITPEQVWERLQATGWLRQKE
jgi:ADP-heptose:LPS heptosyltransferase